MTMTRRDFAGLAMAALPAAPLFAATNSTFNGVKLGIGSYSFRGSKLDDIVSQVAAIPLGEVELEWWFVEPGVSTAGRGGMNPEQRETLRQWRMTVPMAELSAIRKKFADAGINIPAYFIPMDDSFTDGEIDRVFQMTQALGAGILNVSTTLSLAPRLVAPAAQYRIRVGFHPTTGPASPNNIGSGESFRKAAALSPNFGICPDLGGSGNWGAEPLAFLREMHDRITTLHTHDRMGFGQGTAPVKDILLMIRNEKFTFVPMLERISPLKPETTNLAELKNMVEYCKTVLAG